MVVLVVDDEKKYLELIGLLLRPEGLKIIEASNGFDALKLFSEKKPDLIILDVMLPDISGFDVCKKIRKSSDVPILFLSALEDEGYHVIGYRSGGDDYIAKPFSSSIFVLKIKRMLERIRQDEPKTICVSGIVLDMDAHTCFVNDSEAELTQKEFSLLAELMKKRGRVLTREYLLEEIWGYEYTGGTRTVDTQIKKLRKKLGSQGSLIKTVVSVGYKLEDNV